MKHLLFVMAVLGLFFVSTANAATSTSKIPLSVVVQKHGLSKQVSRGNVFCASESASRNGKYGRKVVYSKAIYYVFDQMELRNQGYGELMVSADTKCFSGSIKGYDTNVQWRTTYYYAPQWELQGWYYVSLKMLEKPNRFCRAQMVGVAYDRIYSSNDHWKEKNFQKVMFEVLSGGGIKGSPYEIYETYVSRDIKCFSSMKEAQKGGYRLITNW